MLWEERSKKEARRLLWRLVLILTALALSAVAGAVIGLASLS